MDGAGRQPDRQGRVFDRLVLGAGWVGVALAVILGIRVHLRQLPPERGIGDAAFAAVYGTPAVLALMARRRRPALLATATALSWVLAFTATPRPALVLVSVGFVYLALFLGAPDPPVRARASLPVVAATVLAGELLAGVTLFAGTDPRCWVERRTDGGTHYVRVPASRCEETGVAGAGDVTTALEGSVSLGVTAATLAAAWWLTGPRESGARR